MSGIEKKCLCQLYLYTVSRVSPYLAALKICVCYTLFKTLLLAVDYVL